MTKNIKIFFYNPRFPKSGWLQQCICCSQPTSELEHTGYYKDKYLFQTYMCLTCKNQKYMGDKETNKRFYEITKRYVTIFLMNNSSKNIIEL